jgi:hypothetical protein
LRFQFQHLIVCFCGDENDLPVNTLSGKTLAETVTGLPVFKLAT